MNQHVNESNFVSLDEQYLSECLLTAEQTETPKAEQSPDIMPPGEEISIEQRRETGEAQLSPEHDDSTTEIITPEEDETENQLIEIERDSVDFGDIEATAEALETSEEIDEEPSEAPPSVAVIAQGITNVVLYSTMQEWIEADESNESFATQFQKVDTPVFLRTQEISSRLWENWIGQSQIKQAKAAIKQLRLPTVNMHPARNRNMPNVSNETTVNNLLSSLLLGTLSQSIHQQMNSKDLSAINLSRRLDANLSELLGETVKEINQTIIQSSTLELATYLEQAWPFLSELHNNGIFLRPFARPLLLLAALREQLSASTSGAGAAQRHARLCLAVRLLLEPLPPRLICALGVQTPSFHECTAPGGFQYFGLNRDNIDLECSFWPQLNEATRRSSLAYFRCVMESAEENNVTGALGQVRQLDAQLVLQSRLPRTLDNIYHTFCHDEAMPRYAQLRETLERYSAALEIPMDNTVLPRDLVGRSLHLASIQDQASVHCQLRRLIETEPSHVDTQTLLKDSQIRLDRLAEIHQKIVSLSGTPSVGNLLKISKIANEGREEISSNKEWYEGTLAKTKPYVKLWEDFYRSITELRDQKRTNKKEEREKPPVKLTPVTTETVTPVIHQVVMPETEAVHKLQSELSAAREEINLLHTDFEQQSEELREVCREKHRLQQQNEALTANNTGRNEGPEINVALLRKVIKQRDSLTPIEILSYFEYLAGDRLDLLPSAKREASNYSNNFNYSERLFDLLDKLVFDYLDAINNGTPDTQARTIFTNNAYSACESHTTMNTQHMCKQREFTYRGERHVFQRHLRLGNNPGFEGMRVYFEIIDKRVVIAYVGRHLDVSSTN